MSCFSTPEQKRDKQIGKKVSEWMKLYNDAQKLLLLGAGESGKTTIIKQMKILHINGFSAEEQREKAADIRRNVLESMVTLCQNLSSVGCALANPDNTAAMQRVLGCWEQLRHVQEDRLGEVLDQQFYDDATALWRDEGIQSTHAQQHQFQLIDCAKYFLDKLEVIRDPSYIPDVQDILNSRKMTTDLSKIQFDLPIPKKYFGGNQTFWMFDVGGQKGERKKWIQVFDGIRAVLFLVASSCYDQATREDAETNRLEDSLEIFHQVWQSRFLRSAGFILFLNKQDKLKEKVLVENKSIAEIFPGYVNYELKKHDKVPGEDPEYLRTRCYIRDLFLDITCIPFDLAVNRKPSAIGHGINFQENEKKKCYSHFTTATDTNNIKHVFEDVYHMIIMENVEHMGLPY